MKYYFLIGAIILSACNSTTPPNKEKGTESIGNEIYEYPQQIKKLHLSELYDSAKWYLYTWNCDALYKPKNDSSITKPFGELELRFYNLVITHDTLILIFDFMDGEQPILSSMTRDDKTLVAGIGFDTITKNKIYMVGPNMTMKYKGDPRNRYENPLQPEVIAFIKSNKNKLYPWFREEAKRRKIID